MYMTSEISDPNAKKRYNTNQKDNVDGNNNNIADSTNNKLFEYTNRTTAVKHAQLIRYLYDIHVVDSPACQCGLDFEDTITYLTVHYL